MTAPNHTSGVEFVADDDVQALLDDPGFIESWQRLQADCPWATAYQTPAFVSSWYRCYADGYRPVLVLERDTTGAVNALFPLAATRSGALLVGAGHHQAEYQCWICRPDSALSFGLAALALLRANFPAHDLYLKYLPGHPMLEICVHRLLTDPRVRVRPHQRPLQRLRSEDVAASLRKKSNKSKLNRLRRLGEVRIQTLTDAGERIAALNALIPFYELRQGAVNDNFPFTDDANKHDFHVRLLKECGEHVNMTVTRVGDQVAAGIIGFRNSDCVSVGIIAYSPMLAAHSPGKVHLMLAAAELVEQGVNILDLTPGGDSWKERFANDHDDVFELTAHASRFSVARTDAVSRVSGALKRVLGWCGIEPAMVRRLAGLVDFRLPFKLLRWLRVNSYRRIEYRVYRLDAHGIRRCADASGFDGKVDSIADALCFTPGEGWQTRQRFYSSILATLEGSTHLYTTAADGVLLHYGKMTRSQDRAHFSEVDQEYHYPPSSAVLFDFYSLPKARGRGLYGHTIRRMLSDLANDDSVQHAYISVDAKNAASRHVIEKIGFEYVESLYARMVMGRLIPTPPSPPAGNSTEDA